MTGLGYAQLNPRRLRRRRRLGRRISWSVITTVIILFLLGAMLIAAIGCTPAASSKPSEEGNPFTIDNSLTAPIVVKVDRRNVGPNGKVRGHLATLTTSEKILGVDLPRSQTGPARVVFAQNSAHGTYELVVEIDPDYDDLMAEGVIPVTYFRRSEDSPKVAYELHYVLVVGGPLPPSFVPGTN